jgi:hypothetical protein
MAHGTKWYGIALQGRLPADESDVDLLLRKTSLLKYAPTVAELERKIKGGRTTYKIK